MAKLTKELITLMRAAENRYSISTVLILYIYTTCHSIKSQNNLLKST